MNDDRLSRNDDEITADDASAPGWLDRIRARLGLASGPDLRETIEAALQTEPESEAIFTPQERAMLLNLLRFGALRVEDVMVPRADIIAIDGDASVNELLQLFEQAGHSRVPVYHETLDDPRGMVHIKDLMAWVTGQSTPGPVEETDGAEGGSEAQPPEPRIIDLRTVDLTATIAEAKIRREVIFVPPSMAVLDLLLRMQTTRIHLALVVDEYGGTDGLVSIEDLVEEIVGEIEDEHDQSDGPLVRVSDEAGLVADARVPIEQLEAYLGCRLLSAERDEDVDTLGGLVFTLVGRVPVRGELVPHTSGIEFEVLDADPRRIKTLRIHLDRERSASPAANGRDEDKGKPDDD